MKLILAWPVLVSGTYFDAQPSLFTFLIAHQLSYETSILGLKLELVISPPGKHTEDIIFSFTIQEVCL